MHPKLSKSPLTYVLAQVRISNINDISDFIDRLQGKIRDVFPHFQPMSFRAIRLDESQVPSSSEVKQWHFIDKEKQVGIILDKQSIVIHATQYDQFQDLVEKFKEVLKRFNELLDIALFTRLGLRYVNLIVDGMKNVDRGLLGFHLKKDAIENQFLTKTETTQRSEQGVIKIQATRVGDKKAISGIQNYFVPPDLTDSANVLSFKKT